MGNLAPSRSPLDAWVRSPLDARGIGGLPAISTEFAQVFEVRNVVANEYVGFCDRVDGPQFDSTFVEIRFNAAPAPVDPELAEWVTGFQFVGSQSGYIETLGGTLFCDRENPPELPAGGWERTYNLPGNAPGYIQAYFTPRDVYRFVFAYLWYPGFNSSPWIPNEFISADYIPQWYPQISQVPDRTEDYWDPYTEIFTQEHTNDLVEDGTNSLQILQGPPELSVVDYRTISTANLATVGVHTVEVEQSNVKGTDTMSYQLEIVAPPPPVITGPPSVTTVQQGQLYSAFINTTLPPGLPFQEELVDGPQTGEVPAQLGGFPGRVIWQDSTATIGAFYDFHYRISNAGGFDEIQWQVEVLPP